MDYRRKDSVAAVVGVAVDSPHQHHTQHDPVSLQKIDAHSE
jgi:hypothetical protein